MRSLLQIVLISLLLASCSKEEVVSPMAGAGTGVEGAFHKGANEDGVTDPADGSGSISDDGDDLNDGEGRRKKKKP
ncbi:MAG: hypothetical protein R2817_13810 [Flavobacteriales bacterium]